MTNTNLWIIYNAVQSSAVGEPSSSGSSPGQMIYIPSDRPVVQCDLEEEILRNPRQQEQINKFRAKQPSDASPNDLLNWAYRCFRVTVQESSDPGTLGDSALDHEQLFQNYLYLFNAIVALEWQPSPAYMQQLEITFRRASNFLYDVTDGYMAIGQVVFGGAELMQCADIQIMASNRFNPRSWVSGLHEEQKYMPIRMGRGVWHKNNRVCIPWDEPEGYRTLVHEWAHYALELRDEYFEPCPVLVPSQVSYASMSNQVLVSGNATLIIPKFSLASELIMAMLEGTSELVPHHRGKSAERKRDQWDTIAERFKNFDSEHKPLEGPSELLLPLPRFYRVASLASDAALSHDYANPAHLAPGIVGIEKSQILWLADQPVVACLDPSVAGINCARIVVSYKPKRVGNISVQLLLIVLNCQHVLGALLHDLARYGGLAADCVHGYGAVAQVEQLQQRRDGGDLIRFGIDGALRQHQAALLRPDTDEMNGIFANAAVVRATQCLAIDGDDLAEVVGPDRLHPTDEVLLELGCVERREDTPKGIVRRNAVGQCEIALQPGLFGLVKGFYANSRVGATNDGTNRDRDDITERMVFGALDGRIGEGSKSIIQAVPDFSHCAGSWQCGKVPLSTYSITSFPANQDAIALEKCQRAKRTKHENRCDQRLVPALQGAYTTPSPEVSLGSGSIMANVEGTSERGLIDQTKRSSLNCSEHWAKIKAAFSKNEQRASQVFLHQIVQSFRTLADQQRATHLQNTWQYLLSTSVHQRYRVLVEESDILTNVDGYVVTSGRYAIITLRSSLADDEKRLAEAALRKHLTPPHKPGIYFWNLRDDETKDEVVVPPTTPPAVV